MFENWNCRSTTWLLGWLIGWVVDCLCFNVHVLCSVAAIYFLWKYYRQNCKQSQKITSISPKVVFLVSHVEDWSPACAALLEDLSSLKVLLVKLLVIIYSIWLEVLAMIVRLYTAYLTVSYYFCQTSFVVTRFVCQ